MATYFQEILNEVKKYTLTSECHFFERQLWAHTGNLFHVGHSATTEQIAVKHSSNVRLDLLWGGSVFNEAFHTFAAAASLPGLVENLAEHENPTMNIVGITLNVALVGLQRYNRARMQRRVNQELEMGKTFSPNYKNWLGIDGRAVEKYEDSLSKVDGLNDEVSTDFIVFQPNLNEIEL